MISSVLTDIISNVEHVFIKPYQVSRTADLKIKCIDELVASFNEAEILKKECRERSFVFHFNVDGGVLFYPYLYRVLYKHSFLYKIVFDLNGVPDFEGNNDTVFMNNVISLTAIGIDFWMTNGSLNELAVNERERFDWDGFILDANLILSDINHGEQKKIYDYIWYLSSKRIPVGIDTEVSCDMFSFLKSLGVTIFKKTTNSFS